MEVRGNEYGNCALLVPLGWQMQINIRNLVAKRGTIMTNARASSRVKRIGHMSCGFMAAGVVMNVSTRAWALDVDPPSTPPVQKAPPPAKESNGATVRPIAIRLEGSWSLGTGYSVGITGGYAFHRLFALESTLGWEGGFMHGIMGRLGIPITPSSSLSAGLGATLLWNPFQGEHNWRGTYLWLPGEIGYEYREKEGFTFLLGVSARRLTYTVRGPSDSTW